VASSTRPRRFSARTSRPFAGSSGPNTATRCLASTKPNLRGSDACRGAGPCHAPRMVAAARRHESRVVGCAADARPRDRMLTSLCLIQFRTSWNLRFRKTNVDAKTQVFPGLLFFWGSVQMAPADPKMGVSGCQAICWLATRTSHERVRPSGP
jgi:hypothetical protein